jgi:hypothetical protein
MKRLFVILALATSLGVGAPSLMADHGDHGHKHGNKHFDDDDDQRWERRDGYEYRAFAKEDDRPPGWSHGQKTGWRNCGLPPGQAKKYGCRTYIYEGRRHYYYEDEEHRIIVRRPIITVQGSVNVF